MYSQIARQQLRREIHARACTLAHRDDPDGDGWRFERRRGEREWRGGGRERNGGGKMKCERLSMCHPPTSKCSSLLLSGMKNDFGCCLLDLNAKTCRVKD